MIVDDEPDVASILQKLLRMKGYDSDVFTDTALALKNFGAGKYEVVVMDFKMPGGLNGFEVYEKLREVDHNVKILFLSGDSSHYAEYMKKYPAAPTLRYMHKPALMQDIAREIAAILKA